MALGTGTSNRVKIDNFGEHFTGSETIGKIWIANTSGVIVSVLDLTTHNALAVALVDADGNQITSFGGGTQYTEDAAAAANPIGNATILVRADTPAGAVTTDGDNVAQRGTNFGAGYVQVVDSAGAFVDTFGGGTQYTEDAAAAANPVGGATILVRADTPGALVTTDGDNVAQRGTNFGAGFVQVVDSAGAFVDTFGGGTQYTEDAAAAANPVGNALIMVRDDALTGQTTTDGDNVAVRGTDKGELYVKHADTIAVTQSGTWDEVGINDSGNSITVDGTITEANSAAIAASLAAIDTDTSTIVGHVDGLEGLIGTTNTNTAASTTALQIIDDWDESDRAKVNLIAGQAGVQGAYGAVTALTQRVTEAAVTTATLSSVADSASSVALLASTAGRLGAVVHNDSTEVAYIKFGATASVTSYTYRLEPNGTLEFPRPMWTGAVDAIWANNASGSARITEFT